MESITENKLRIGNFTSSEIYRLLGSKSVRENYIEEKRAERKLNRSLTLEAYSNDMAWGTFLQQRVHNLLGFEYILCTDETKPHPTVEGWSGSQDFIVPGLKVSELKCYQPKKFSTLTDALYTKDPEQIKDACPKEYWQAISNAIINQVPKAELITYMPYRSELETIRQMALEYDKADAWKYEFIFKRPDAWLAWLPDEGSIYKNLNLFEFDVPQTDIDFLTNQVEKAVKLLNQ